MTVETKETAMKDAKMIADLAAKIINETCDFHTDPLIMLAALKVAAEVYQQNVTAHQSMALMVTMLDKVGT